jgi:tRNA A37 threonylcarbamoyltransferase TsaD
MLITGYVILTGHSEESSVEQLLLGAGEGVRIAVLQLPGMAPAVINVRRLVSTILHVVRAHLPLIPVHHEAEAHHTAPQVQQE